MRTGDSASALLYAPQDHAGQRTGDVTDLINAGQHASKLYLSNVGPQPFDELMIEQLHADVEHLSIEYLTTSPRTVLAHATWLRQDVHQALIASRRPDEMRALHLAHGRLSGILAYVAMDLGEAHTARTHTRAALMSAQLVGDRALEAWVRGTQSLVARFQGRFRDALNFARAGRALGADGTAGVRLWCAEAQSLSQLGDTRAALNALDAARDASEQDHKASTEYGIFGFPPSKLPYYVGSTLIWLPGSQHASMAVTELTNALDLFGREHSDVHSPVDYTLTHIYRATAYLLAHDLDAASDALRPVLDTSPHSTVSWHARRLDRVRAILQETFYRPSPTARTLALEIDSFAFASAAHTRGLQEGTQ